MEGMGPLTPENIASGAKVWQPVGPTSDPVAPGWLIPRALTTDECRAMVRTWANAARNAVAAGFDTIEIHTAHGYLLASFLSPISNTRNDEYGGDRTGRMRLPLEIVKAVRREMPDSMPLFVRVSAVDGAKDGWNMDDTVVYARELKARGVDVIDCSSGGISGSATAAQVPRGLGFQVPYAERVRNEVGIASMAVGIILEAQQAEAILEEWTGRPDRGRPAVPVQSEYRAALGPRSRHQPQVRGLDARIWLVAREANSDHGRVRDADRGGETPGSAVEVRPRRPWSGVKHPGLRTIPGRDRVVARSRAERNRAPPKRSPMGHQGEDRYEQDRNRPRNKTGFDPIRTRSAIGRQGRGEDADHQPERCRG